MVQHQVHNDLCGGQCVSLSRITGFLSRITGLLEGARAETEEKEAEAPDPDMEQEEEWEQQADWGRAARGREQVLGDGQEDAPVSHHSTT